MGCDIHWHIERRENGIWKLVWPSKIIVYKDEHEERVEEGYAEPFDPAKWPEVTLFDGSWDEAQRELGFEHYSERLKHPFYVGRNYDLFALLAGVRGDLVPIAEPRGIPDDCSNGYLWEATEGTGDIARVADWHSHSYLGLDELLAIDWTKPATKRGWVDATEFMRFKIEGSPSSWSGGVGGGGTKKISNEEMAELPGVKEILDLLEKDRDAADAALRLYESSVRTGHYTLLTWEIAYEDHCKHFKNETIPAMKELVVDGDLSSVRACFFFDN